MITRFLHKVVKATLLRSPAVAILGPRQVGKTTLARTISKEKAGFHYLDLENPLDRRKLENSFNYLDSFRDTCVILDEVQLMPELFSVLRPLIDEYRVPGRFILLGSASPSLIKGLSESLAGRIAYLELNGIGLLELPAKNEYKKNWFRGGFPNALLPDTDEESRAWLNDFIRSYIERDLNHLLDLNLSSLILRNFWSMLAHNTGSIWNAEVFARSLGVSAPTVVRYLSVLEGAFIVRRLSPWFVNAKKRLIKSPKVYIRDTGIVHRFLNIPDFDSLLGHPVIGGSWEGYVIEQIYQQRSYSFDIYFYRTQAGAECDLVLVRGITTIACIEIKLSNTPTVSRGFFNCIEDLQPQCKYIITPASDTYTTSHGVVITNLYHFITVLLPGI